MSSFESKSFINACTALRHLATDPDIFVREKGITRDEKDFRRPT
jgi:hypothetical protein